MRSRLFTFFSAVSLLLSIAVCVLWEQSHKYHLHTWWARPNWGVGFTVYRGSASVGVGTAIAGTRSRFAAVDQLPTPVETGWHQDVTPASPDIVLFLPHDPHWTRFGFTYATSESMDRELRRTSEREVIFPNWVVALGTAVLPTVWLSRALRGRRHRASGLCRSCGYDLRATPERCPECGAVPKG